MNRSVEAPPPPPEPPRRQFPLALDIAVCVGVLLLGLAAALILNSAVWDQSLGPAGIAIQTVVLSLAVAFVLGFLVTPVHFVLPSRTGLSAYLERIVEEGRPPVIGHVMVWGSGVALIAGLVATAMAISAALGIVWALPTVVWLSGFHHVNVLDAAAYAVTLEQGRPEYDGPRGINTDPTTIGFFIFTVAGWAIIIGALAVVASPFYFWYRHRESKRLDRWLSENRTSPRL